MVPATVKQGFVDSGWKDTIIVWPGERVKIAMKFEPYAGMYMYHCHILVREDMTMMRNMMIMDPSMPGMSRGLESQEYLVETHRRNLTNTVGFYN
jgi:hypothetical protein